MDEAFRILEFAKESGFEEEDFKKSHQAHDSFTKSGNSAGKGLFNPNQTKIVLFDETEAPKHDEEIKKNLEQRAGIDKFVKRYGRQWL